MARSAKPRKKKSKSGGSKPTAAKANEEKLLRDQCERLISAYSLKYPDVWDAMNKLSGVLWQSMKLGARERLLSIELELRLRHTRAMDNRTLAAFQHVSMSASMKSRHAYLEYIVFAFRAEAKRQSAENDIDWQYIQLDHAQALLSQGRYQDALDIFAEVERIANENKEENNLTLINCLKSQAKCLMELQRLEEAKAVLRQMWLDYSPDLEYDDIEEDIEIDILGSKRRLAFCLQLQGRLEEAELLFIEVLDYFRNKYGPDDLETIYAGFNHGQNLMCQQRMAEAEAVFKAILDTLIQNPDPSALIIRSAKTAVALCSLFQQPLDVAALDTASKELGAQHAQYVIYPNVDPDLAALLMQALLPQLRDRLGAEHPLHVEISHEYMMTLYDNRRFPRMLQVAENLMSSYRNQMEALPAPNDQLASYTRVIASLIGECRLLTNNLTPQEMLETAEQLLLEDHPFPAQATCNMLLKRFAGAEAENYEVLSRALQLGVSAYEARAQMDAASRLAYDLFLLTQRNPNATPEQIHEAREQWLELAEASLDALDWPFLADTYLDYLEDLHPEPAAS